MPINPCGMAVDWGRGGHVRGMRFFQDRPDIVVPVRWYVVPDDAKQFPGYTRFANGDWAWDKTNWDGPGEVLEWPRQWSNGATPATATGQGFCGTLTEFAEGLTYDPNRPPTLYDWYGIPTCCPSSSTPLCLWLRHEVLPAVGELVNPWSDSSGAQRDFPQVSPSVTSMLLDTFNVAKWNSNPSVARLQVTAAVPLGTRWTMFIVTQQLDAPVLLRQGRGPNFEAADGTQLFRIRRVGLGQQFVDATCPGVGTITFELFPDQSPIYMLRRTDTAFELKHNGSLRGSLPATLDVAATLKSIWAPTGTVLPGWQVGCWVGEVIAFCGAIGSTLEAEILAMLRSLYGSGPAAGAFSTAYSTAFSGGV